VAAVFGRVERLATGVPSPARQRLRTTALAVTGTALVAVWAIDRGRRPGSCLDNGVGRSALDHDGAPGVNRPRVT
jgi:hypothetical protein